MAKNREYVDNSVSVYERGYFKTETWEHGFEHHGHVQTINGVVEVYSRRFRDGTGHTSLELIHNQRQWRRGYSDFFQPRTLVTLAKRFALDVVEGNDDDTDS